MDGTKKVAHRGSHVLTNVRTRHAKDSMARIRTRHAPGIVGHHSPLDRGWRLSLVWDKEGGAACPQATGRGAGATSHLVLSSVVSWFISCHNPFWRIARRMGNTEPLSRTATWRPDCRPVSSPIPTGCRPRPTEWKEDFARALWLPPQANTLLP